MSKDLVPTRLSDLLIELTFKRPVYIKLYTQESPNEHVTSMYVTSLFVRVQKLISLYKNIVSLNTRHLCICEYQIKQQI